MNELAETLAKALETEGERRANEKQLGDYVAAVALRMAARDVRHTGLLLDRSREYRAKTVEERVTTEIS